MNLSSPFISRPVMTTLLMVAIVFFGLLAFYNLAVSDLPSVDYPSITVSASNPGADSETMAASVATPLEKQFMAIEDIDSVISSSIAGATQIALTFNLDRDIDAASTDVAAAITRASGDLPPEMPSPPTYLRYSPSASPIMYLSASSDSMTMADLYDIVNTSLAQRVSMINGVSLVQIYGAKRAFYVKINPDAIVTRELGLDQVAQAIKTANSLLPSGILYNKNQSYSLLPKGQLLDLPTYENVIVAYQKGGPVRIRDIGTVVEDIEVQNLLINYWNRAKGETPTIVFAVLKQPGSNTVQICKDIQALIGKLQGDLPPSIDIDIIYNASKSIVASLHEVEITLIVALLLVASVIFLFLGRVSAALIPIVTLPLSMIGTFVLMYLCGYSMDNLSTIALILVIGFLVDDAIVVLENIVRHMEMGKTPLNAALDGSRQISTTILSMTLSLGAVFIPILFMQGIIGRMFHEFAMVVVIAVLFSGFITLSLSPMLCSRFLRCTERKTRIEDLSHRTFLGMLTIYRPMLQWSLRHRWVPVLAAGTTFCIGLYLFTVLPKNFLPAGDTGIVQGAFMTAQNVSPLALNDFQKQVGEIAKNNPNVMSFASGSNLPTAIPNQGAIYMFLKPYGARPPIQTVIHDLNMEYAKMCGVQVYLRPYPLINLDVGTNQSPASYSYYLSSLGSSSDLYTQATNLQNEMATYKELTDVSSNIYNAQPQQKIEILRDQAATYGVTVEQIENALSLGFAAGRLATYSTPIDTYWIIMELEDAYREDPDKLRKLYITSDRKRDNNSLVPLSAVTKMTPIVGPLVVNHQNQLNSATLYFNVAPGVALGDAVKKVEAASSRLLSPTILRQFLGEAQVFQGTMKSLTLLMIIGIAAIYFFLGVLYESFIHPLTILSALPGALFGAFVTLIVFNEALSLYAYVGIIVLIGLVMKNGIMLVEFANELTQEGKGAMEAIISAVETRFRPIMMTTVAAGVGAIPILLSTNVSLRPLGLTIIGGLFFSQLVTLFFTPIAFLFLENVQRSFRKKKQPN